MSARSFHGRRYRGVATGAALCLCFTSCSSGGDDATNGDVTAGGGTGMGGSATAGSSSGASSSGGGKAGTSSGTGGKAGASSGGGGGASTGGGGIAGTTSSATGAGGSASGQAGTSQGGSGGGAPGAGGMDSAGGSGGAAGQGAFGGSGPHPGPAVLGLHDGAINHCDNFESWYGPDKTPIFGAPGYPDYPATAEEMGNAPWWVPMGVGTVRVSVPWDIAMPWSLAHAGLVTAHDPAGAWSQNHLEALKNEQTCFDWWLSAALSAGEVVNIAFKPDYDYRDPSTNHILAPDIDTYRKAIADFVDEYVHCTFGGENGACVPSSNLSGGPGPAKVAQVHIITPWGEPDYASGQYPHSSTDTSPGCTAGCQGNDLPSASISRAKEVFFLPGGSSPMDPKRGRFDDPSCPALTDSECGPVLAAQMWMAVFAACPECMLTSGPTAGKPNSGVVAGDFSGGGGLLGGAVPDGKGGTVQQSYLKTYTQHLDNCPSCQGVRPLTWGLHPYPDASNEEWCRQNTGSDYDPAANNGSGSTTERFLDALYKQSYGENTFVWLDEVSVFATDNYMHSGTSQPQTLGGKSCGVNSTGAKPKYTPATEASSFLWLYAKLPLAKGTLSPGHEPTVNRIYYFRSFLGADPDGDNITPDSPTPNQKALYDAIVTR